MCVRYRVIAFTASRKTVLRRQLLTEVLMRMESRIRIRSVFAAFLLLMASCGKDAPPVVAVSTGPVKHAFTNAPMLADTTARYIVIFNEGTAQVPGLAKALARTPRA